MEFPITIENQDEFDELVSKRLSREREKIERQAGIEEYRKLAEEAEARAQEAEARAYQRVLVRDAKGLLGSMGVEDAKRQDRIMRLVDLSDLPPDAHGDPDLVVLARKFKSLAEEMPEAFPPGSSPLEKGLDTSLGAAADDGGEIVSREQVESMSPEEINGRWPQIKAFLSGERN